MPTLTTGRRIAIGLAGIIVAATAISGYMLGHAWVRAQDANEAERVLQKAMEAEAELWARTAEPSLWQR